MTPQQAAAHLVLLEQKVVENIRDAEMETAIHGRAIALSLTSGPFKTAYLRKFRPGLYSKAAPRPPADPALINIQSGLLNRSWQLSQETIGPHIVTSIFNESEHARFIAASGGPGSKMMKRPIEERIAERLAPVRIRNLSEAIRKALST